MNLPSLAPTLRALRDRPPRKSAAAAFSGGTLDGTGAAWLERLMGAIESSAGITVTPGTALNLAAVFRCVEWRSLVIGHLPIEVNAPSPASGPPGRVSPDGRNPLPGHPAGRLLNVRPNGVQTPLEFRQWLEKSWLLRGRYFVYKHFSPLDGSLEALIPLDPDRVRMRLMGGWRNPEPVFDYWPEDETGPVTFLAPQVLYAYDPVAPGGRIAKARETLGIAMAAQEHTGRTWKNGARITGVLSTDSKLSPEAAARISKDWHDKYGGSGNSGKIVALEQGLKFQNIAMTSADAELLMSRKFDIVEICRWFGVPPHICYDLDRSTNNNIEHQSIEVTTHTVAPMAVHYEQAFRLRLLTPDEIAGGLYFKHNLNALLRGDMKSRWEAYQLARQNGVLSANEIRALEDLNPRADAGGSVPWRPVNMTWDDERPPRQPSAAPAAPGDTNAS